MKNSKKSLVHQRPIATASTELGGGVNMARRKYLDRDGLLSQVKSAISEAVHFRITSQDLNAKLSRMVWDTPDYQRLTQVERSFIAGFTASHRSLLVDMQTVGGNWFLMPDGSERFHAAFDPLPEGVSHRDISERRLPGRCGLFWRTERVDRGGTHPYFITDEGGAK